MLIKCGDDIVAEAYSYADLSILRMSRAIRDKKLNMRSVCIALRHLIERFGPPNQGWANVHVHIENNHVYADKSDEWDITAADQGGQRVETRLFGDVFDILRDMDEEGAILLPKGFSQCVAIDPAVMGGMPIIKDTRIPTAVVARKNQNGTTVSRLVDLFRPVSKQCIESAIGYEEYLNSPITKVGEVTSRR